MRDITLTMLFMRFSRKILTAILVCCTLYFFISVMTSLTGKLGSDDVQGSKVIDERGGAMREVGGGGNHQHHKNPQRKIQRIPHRPLPGEDARAGAGEDDFSSSSTSDTGEDAQEEENVKPSKKLPQAIIIGVKKGGTRALLDFISLHPDVVPAKQEVHFFDQYYDNGLEWYREQMEPSKPGQITIEKTPSYFMTKEVPGRVRKMGRDVKLIVILRDPVTRALSDYAQALARGKRTSSEKFDDLVIDHKTGEVDKDFYPIMVGLYDEHLERWLKYFPRSQFLFINGDQLVRNPAPQLVKVQKFLNIDVIVDDSNFIYNASKGFYCVKKPEAVAAGSEEVKCLGNSKGRAHPEVAPSVLNDVRQFFKPHNEKFYRMIGENYHWGEEEERRRRRR